MDSDGRRAQWRMEGPVAGMALEMPLGHWQVLSLHQASISLSEGGGKCVRQSHYKDSFCFCPAAVLSIFPHFLVLSGWNSVYLSSQMAGLDVKVLKDQLLEWDTTSDSYWAVFYRDNLATGATTASWDFPLKK